MESKDKIIGTILIIVGLFFIGMGVYIMMNTPSVATQNNVYDEQQVENNDNNETNIEIYDEQPYYNVNGEIETQYIY